MKKLPILMFIAAAVACVTVFVACGSRTSSATDGAGSASDGTPDSASSGAPASSVPMEGTLPSKFDLRDKGVVTPVKFQNPWGSCWAFGGTAAAETSILSTLGMTTEQYKQKTGYDFDLSEKHLVWFSRLPITSETNTEQAGEGLGVVGWPESGDQLAMYDGGDSTLITPMFANGVGPVDEDLFPYRGKEGITEYDYFSSYETDPADVQAAKRSIVRKKAEQDLEMTLDEAVQKVVDGNADAKELFKELYDKDCLDDDFPQAGKAKDDLVKELEDAYYKCKVETSHVTNFYTSHDDWVIPTYEETEDGQKLPNRDITCGYTLLHGNVLPETVIRDADNRQIGINQDAIAAIKSELIAGRGVSVRFFADQSIPGQALSKNGYMNQNTWAHYTYDDRSVSHGVCIIGWDDTIAKEAFSDDPAKQPPAGGAWIVKNSWGSETEFTTSANGETIGYKDWGIVNEDGKHTGYFYLSYYDKSVDSPESMEFNTDFAKCEGEFRVWAHDYMPCTVDWTDTQSNMLKTANVFVNDTGTDQEMRSVGTRTAQPGAQVTFGVYLLSEGAKNPEDGELVATQTATFRFKGFHRQNLSNPITIKNGQRFSVVVMEKQQDQSGADQYSFATVCSNSKKYADESDYPAYGIPVLHEGESFVYEDGKWSDWVEALPKFREAHEAGDDYVFENFSIKAYMVSKS